MSEEYCRVIWDGIATIDIRGRDEAFRLAEKITGRALVQVYDEANRAWLDLPSRPAADKTPLNARRHGNGGRPADRGPGGGGS